MASMLASLSIVVGLVLVMFQASRPTLAGALVALPGALAFALHRRQIVAARPPLLLLAFFAWSAVSVTWSINPGSTASSVLVTGALLALGLLLVWGRDISQVAQLIAWSGLLLTALSMAMGVALPRTGLSAGHLKGPTPHENQLAFIIALTFVSVVVLLLEGRLSRLLGLPALAVLVVALLWSDSKTGLLISAVTLLVLVVVRTIARLPGRWHLPLILITLLLGSGSVLLTVLNRAFVTQAVGRDVTFTGRTEIWQVVWALASQQPVQGYGFGAVWSPSSPIGGTVARLIYYFPSHAHNGYLDTYLQLGSVGAVLLILVLVGSMARHSTLLLRGGSTWPLAMTILLILYNISETRFLDYTGWLLLVIVASISLAGARVPVGRGTRPSSSPTMPTRT